MRKKMFVFSIAILLLTGCTERANEIIEKPVGIEPVKNNDAVDKHPIEVLIADPAKFHFAAGWLTNSKILYVEKDEGFYKVKSFDVDSGESETLYEETSIIIELLIHPSKNYLLLHTSKNPTSATVKILTTDGVVQDEIEVASTELAIEWNDLDPSLIILTAFHQDWTFDLFLYNGKESYFGLLEIEDPFPKWYGENQIAIGYVEEHILDGGEIRIYDPKTGNWSKIDQEGIIFFDTYEDSLLTVQIYDDGDAHYRIMDNESFVRSEWTLPALSNYSEWIIPEIEWLSNSSVILSAPTRGGQLDELTSPNRLIKVTAGIVEVISDKHAASLIRCSSSASKCMIGTSLDTVIDVNTGKENSWLQFLE